MYTSACRLSPLCRLWVADLPVLGLDVVGEGLGLLVAVVVVVVAVVVLGSDVLHLVDAAALGASLDGALTGHLERSGKSVQRTGHATRQVVTSRPMRRPCVAGG
jgi:hypothetical protein